MVEARHDDHDVELLAEVLSSREVSDPCVDRDPEATRALSDELHHVWIDVNGSYGVPHLCQGERDVPPARPEFENLMLSAQSHCLDQMTNAHELVSDSLGALRGVCVWRCHTRIEVDGRSFVGRLVGPAVNELEDLKMTRCRYASV